MLRVTTVWTGMQGTPYYNQLYFSGPDESFAQGAATAAFQCWGSLANAIGPGYEGQILPEVEDVDPSTGQVTDVYQTVTDPLSGFAPGELLPPANQGLLRLISGFYVNGRRLRGRIFVPGPTEAMSTAGAPNATYLGYLNDGLDALITDGAAGGGAIIYSPTHRVTGNLTSGGPWTNNYAVLRSRRD